MYVYVNNLLEKLEKTKNQLEFPTIAEKVLYLCVVSK